MLEKLFARHLEDDEPLHLVVHKHGVFGFRALVLPVSVFLGTGGLLLLLPHPAVALGVLVADAVVGLWCLRNFLDYFLDAWLITDRSVIGVSWHGWFHRSSTRIDYSSIEGVSYEINGALGTLLRFGTVTIEKVGTGTTVSIEHVGNPRKVESAILLAQEACLRTKNLKDSAAVKDILAEFVASQAHLHKREKRRQFPVHNF